MAICVQGRVQGDAWMGLCPNSQISPQKSMSSYRYVIFIAVLCTPLQYCWLSLRRHFIISGFISDSCCFGLACVVMVH